MKKIIVLVIFFGCIATVAIGQKYFSKTGHIYFLSEAPIEKIEATNNNAYAVLDASTGIMEWSVLVKGFRFEKALMQDHFNESYMESNKFPKAFFTGKIINISDVPISGGGQYKVNVEGSLTIRGITKALKAPATITISNGNMKISGSFDVKIADYGIKVPRVVRNNIADTVKVSVSADLQALNHEK